MQHIFSKAEFDITKALDIPVHPEFIVVKGDKKLHQISVSSHTNWQWMIDGLPVIDDMPTCKLYSIVWPETETY